jgi:predicted ribosomally synthesized peptide with SipW-like signal peptide
MVVSLMLFVTAAVAVVTGTTAFLSDTETSVGNTFAAGEIDLKIDNTSYYNGVLNPGTSWELADLDDSQGPGPNGEYFFFNFLDLKPDDEGEDTISIHVDTNPAWACMQVSVSNFDDNDCNEPEAGDGDTTCGPGEGELQEAVNFVWWADDGDNVLEDDETIFFQPQTLANLELNVVLADSTGGLFGPEPLQPDQTYYIGKAWCFGELTLDPVPAGQGVDPTVASGIICDGSQLDNTTQTDSAEGVVSFEAIQSRNVENFQCFEDPRPTCELVETFADAVVSSDQGLRKNTTAIAADRSDPTLALGAPQSTGTPYDNPVVSGSFFSLGFPLEGNAAEIVLSFNDNVVVNGPGMDLKLWEVTGGSSYPDELVDVFVGDAPAGPWTQVGFAVTRDAEIDLGGVSEAQYVRIVDASNIDVFESSADGYDLDAVQALNCVVPDEA